MCLRLEVSHRIYNGHRNDDILVPKTSTYDGRNGLASRVINPEGVALLEGWLLNVPGQAIWSYYIVAVIHLRGTPRPDDEVLQPHKRWPGATHELLVVALDPAYTPKPEDNKTWRYVTPINVAWQFTCSTDDVAKKVCRILACEAADGQLLLEPTTTIQIEKWAARLKQIVGTTRVE
jgi:hypothetical protein